MPRSPRDGELADLGGREPVHLEHADDVVVEAEQRRDEILARGVDRPLGLCVHARDVGAHDEAHDVQIVGAEIERDTHVADARREGADATRADLEHAAERALGELLRPGAGWRG
jgi:hypothetical protein